MSHKNRRRSLPPVVGQVLDRVAYLRCFLELELLRRFSHLLLKLLDVFVEIFLRAEVGNRFDCLR